MVRECRTPQIPTGLLDRVDLVDKAVRAAPVVQEDRVVRAAGAPPDSAAALAVEAEEDSGVAVEVLVAGVDAAAGVAVVAQAIVATNSAHAYEAAAKPTPDSWAIAGTAASKQSTVW